MTISITHAHVSEVANDPTKDVSSEEWNATHTVTGAALLENGVQYGTDWPTSPTPQEGMFCYRTDRDILYLYNGTAWVPVQSFAAMTLYVDPTGTDDSDHGYASGTDAFLTINYALSQVPALYGGNVTISIAAGTYTENVVVRGKSPTGPYTLTLQGALATEVSTTMTGGGNCTVGGDTQATVAKTSAGWTVNAYSRMLCKFTSGSNDGSYRVIESNTADTLTLVGKPLAATPKSGDSFEILSHAVEVSGTVDVYAVSTINDIKATGYVSLWASSYLERCYGTQVANYSYNLVTIAVSSFFPAAGIIAIYAEQGQTTIEQTLAMMQSSGYCILVHDMAKCTARSSVAKGDGGAAANGLIRVYGKFETTYGGNMHCIVKNTTGVGFAAARGGLFYQLNMWAKVSVSTTSAVESASYSYVAAS